MSTASDKMSGHVRRAALSRGHSHLELEWRVGHQQDTFRAGVDPKAWHRLKSCLDASPAFTGSTRVCTERIGGSKRRKVRFDAATGQWVEKERLADVLRHQSADGGRCPWAVRASLSTEVPCAPGDPDQLEYERHKERWSYSHACWSIDLTKVRSNLPSHLDNDTWSYEVEVELADPGMLLERTVEHLVEWGWRIAGEVCDMMVAPPPPLPPPPPRPPPPHP